MLVTARLSKRFYDALGEDVAAELVDWFNALDLAYRTDLRERSERYFAHLDAKLDHRLAQLRADLHGKMAEFRAEVIALQGEYALLRGRFGAAARPRSELGEVMAVHSSELREAIARHYASLVRWMFGFWLATVVPVAALMLALHGR